MRLGNLVYLIGFSFSQVHSDEDINLKRILPTGTYNFHRSTVYLNILVNMFLRIYLFPFETIKIHKYKLYQQNNSKYHHRRIYNVSLRYLLRRLDRSRILSYQYYHSFPITIARYKTKYCITTLHYYNDNIGNSRAFIPIEQYKKLLIIIYSTPV